MPSNQQRRDAAKRHAQRQQSRRAEHAKMMRQRWTIIGVIVVVVAAIGIVWATVGGSDGDASQSDSGAADSFSPDEADGDATDSATDDPAADDSAADDSAADDSGADDPAADDSAADDGADSDEQAEAVDATCAYPEAGPAARPVTAPSDLNPPTSGTTAATIALNSGEVTVELDRAATPCTTNSFVSLAEQGFYDDITCHRLTASASLKVLQCGDPSGSGAGGPGYSFADELSGSETYEAGVLAMANAGPDTNGSQFFLVYGDSMLPPDYAVFGHVTAGMDVLEAIAARGIAGGGQDGAPSDPVTIESVTIDS